MLEFMMPGTEMAKYSMSEKLSPSHLLPYLPCPATEALEMIAVLFFWV